MQYENHLENYLYEGVLQTSIVPISYHSYDGKKRGQEIASFLTFYPDFFEQFLKKGDTILLEVAENNIKAINLYKKYGFEIISRRKKYYKEFDALIMKKVK